MSIEPPLHFHQFVFLLGRERKVGGTVVSESSEEVVPSLKNLPSSFFRVPVCTIEYGH